MQGTRSHLDHLQARAVAVDVLGDGDVRGEEGERGAALVEQRVELRAGRGAPKAVFFCGRRGGIRLPP